MSQTLDPEGLVLGLGVALEGVATPGLRRLPAEASEALVEAAFPAQPAGAPGGRARAGGLQTAAALLRKAEMAEAVLRAACVLDPALR